MRITVIGVFGQGQLADSLAHGLGVLGHVVSPVSDQPLAPPNRFSRLVARRVPELVKWSTNRRRQLELATAVTDTKPEMILVVKSPYLRGSTVDAIRESCAARVINWYPDNPFVNYGQRTPLSALRHYDRIIVFSPVLAKRVQQALKTDVKYIPFGFDPRYYFPAPRPRVIKTDVAFVGQCRPERAELALTLIRAGFSIRVAGPGWGAAAEPVRSAWQPGSTWGADAARLYHQARVGLNDLHARSNAHSHNMRSWEIPATGTPMATTESRHQRELLSGIPAVTYYSGPGDLAAAVDRLIASSAHDQDPVDLSAHTYTERCRQLLATL